MKKQKEMVNHPAHYGGDVVHETYKCLAEWGLTENAYLWNVVKYISRAGKKGDVLEDLKKGRWYLDREIERIEVARAAAQNNPRLKKAWAEINLVRDRIARDLCGRCGQKKCVKGCSKTLPATAAEKRRLGREER